MLQKEEQETAIKRMAGFGVWYDSHNRESWTFKPRKGANWQDTKQVTVTCEGKVFGNTYDIDWQQYDANILRMRNNPRFKQTIWFHPDLQKFFKENGELLTPTDILNQQLDAMPKKQIKSGIEELMAKFFK